VKIATGALILLLAAGSTLAVDLDRTPLEAVTVDGQKVRLFPNGRWEFADAAKAAEAQQLAAQYPENKTRPIEAQGGLFGGFGRTIMPGDKDYNRGSLNPKGR
jgi:hypothetical protein